MIRDGAPGSWTSLMRELAKEIADDARDPEPGVSLADLPEDQWPWSALRVEGYFDASGEWHDGLAEICGVTLRAISDALTELGRQGYEMRQAIVDREGKPVVDRRGRVLYAGKGHALRFRVPPLAPRRPQSSHQSATDYSVSSHLSATYVGNAAPQSSHQGATNGPQRSHPDVSKLAPGCDPVPLSPQRSSPQSRAPRALADKVRVAVPDATDDEIDEFAKQVTNKHAPEDLGRYVAAWSAERIATRIADIRRPRRRASTGAAGQPRWCGECHQRTRMLLDEFGQQGNQPCPRCRPARRAS
jgi:hypothetical protein